MEEETRSVERKEAVAIRYQQGKDQAPLVVAKGKGIVAEHILEAAKTHGIPVYQNKALSSMLQAVQLDREVPPDMYKAVAEVLAYVYRLDQKLGRRRRQL